MNTPTKLPADVETAIYTAVSELPAGTHPDDILDCVCGMVPSDLVWDVHYDLIVARIAQLS